MQKRFSARRGFVFASVLCACAVLATTAAAADPAGETRDAASMVNGLRVKRLVQPLALTAVQQEKFKELMDEEAKKINQTHEETTIERTARIAKQKEIKAEYRKKLEEVLTDEQRKKWAKLDADAQSRRKRTGTTPAKPGATASAPSGKTGAPAN